MKKLVFFFLIVVSSQSYSQFNFPEEFKSFWKKFLHAYSTNDFKEFASLTKSPLIFTKFESGDYKNNELNSTQLKEYSNFYFNNEDIKLLLKDFDGSSGNAINDGGDDIMGSFKQAGDNVILEIEIFWLEGYDVYTFTFEKVKGKYLLTHVSYDEF